MAYLICTGISVPEIEVLCPQIEKSLRTLDKSGELLKEVINSPPLKVYELAEAL